MKLEVGTDLPASKAQPTLRVTKEHRAFAQVKGVQKRCLKAEPRSHSSVRKQAAKFTLLASARLTIVRSCNQLEHRMRAGTGAAWR